MKERFPSLPLRKAVRAYAVAPGPTQGTSPSPRLPCRLPRTALAPQPAAEPWTLRLCSNRGRAGWWAMERSWSSHVCPPGRNPVQTLPFCLYPVRVSHTPHLKANGLGRQFPQVATTSGGTESPLGERTSGREPGCLAQVSNPARPQ